MLGVWTPSPDQRVTRHQLTLARFFALLLPRLSREHIPEPEGFIARPRHDIFTIRRHSQVQHTRGVAGQSLDLLHGGEAPQTNLILAVAVR